MRLIKSEIEQLEQRYRATLINSLAGFRQAVLVGTQSASGAENLAIFNSLIHLGANPALFGLISRPDSVPRDTLKNILETKVYTLNFVSSKYYEKAHQTSARYASSVSEFDQVGLHSSRLAEYKAPFVQEADVKMAMTFEQHIPIALNGTVMIIGSVQFVEVNGDIVGSDGYVDLAAADVLVSQGLDAYFVAQRIGRLPYAKPQ